MEWALMKPLSRPDATLRRRRTPAGDGDGFAPTRPPEPWCRRRRPLEFEHALGAVFPDVVQQAIPVRPGFSLSLMDPQSVHLDHGRLLRHGTEQYAAGLCHGFQFPSARKSQAPPKRLGKNDAAGMIHFDSHAI